MCIAIKLMRTIIDTNNIVLYLFATIFKQHNLNFGVLKWFFFYFIMYVIICTYVCK